MVLRLFILVLIKVGDPCVCVQVISGQQLPKVNMKEGSIIDPLVRVEIHGVSQDQAKQETRHIENNGPLATHSHR